MNKIVSTICGLLGISFVILIHEAGHFITAQLFGITTPVFSIGFGPSLFHVKIGTTVFQIAAIPLGGYVAINEAQLSAQPYWIKMVILLAGIVVNILFAWGVFSFFKRRNINYREMLEKVYEQFKGRGFIGPIGIISMIGNSARLGFNYYLLALASISFSIGIFNLLPVPFLDGGQIVSYTHEALKASLPDGSLGINPLLFMLFILALLLLVLRMVIRKVR